MTAIILGWNPDHANPDQTPEQCQDPWNGRSYASVVEETAERGLYVQQWSLARQGDVPVGTDAWLFLQGSRVRGLIGHGVVVGGQVAFDALLPLGDQITAEVLQEAAPGVPWGSFSGSGQAVDPVVEASLRSVWSESGPAPGPEPTRPVPGAYPDEAVSRVPVNRYERDPGARRACIAHRGNSCAACGFSFEVAYGEIGKDFIDVHHVVPVSQLNGGYRLDPLTDLVPLCANCHAMAHYGVSTPRTEVELRRAMASAGFLRGTATSPGQLEAERVAREILGTEVQRPGNPGAD